MLTETILLLVRDKIRHLIYDAHTEILKMHYRRPDFINQTTQPIRFSVEPQYSQQWCVRAHLLCERSNKFLRR